jgi:hypothetical protein
LILHIQKKAGEPPALHTKLYSEFNVLRQFRQ